MTFTQAFRYEIVVGASSPFSEIASFVDRARDAGAKAETPVQAVPVFQDESIIDYLAIELDAATHVATTTVAVPITVVRQLRDLLGDLQASDGDVRDLASEIAYAHEALVKLSDGEDIGQQIEWG